MRSPTDPFDAAVAAYDKAESKNCSPAECVEMAVAAAIKAERERCVKVVEDWRSGARPRGDLVDLIRGS